MSKWVFVDRIGVTVQNLMIENYEHQMIHILGYKRLCSRDDVFGLLAQVYDSQSEEEYFDRVKRFIVLVKLVAPQILEVYKIRNKIESARGLFGTGYYLAVPLHELSVRLIAVEGECDEYV